MAVSGNPNPVPEKIRRDRFLSRDTLKRFKALDAKIKTAAAKRGPWKDATPEARAEAKRLAAEMADLKAEMRAEQARAASLEAGKRAAAAKREEANSKAGG